MVIHAIACDLDDDCTCAVSLSKVCPVCRATNVRLEGNDATCEGCEWEGLIEDLLEVCSYCAGTGEAYDPVTGEGPACPECACPSA